MVNRLKLKGNELLLYAIIYGFSQDEKSSYEGSLSYISKSINASRRSVISLLNRLSEKNLIIKYVSKDGNEYQHNPEEKERILNGGEISSLGKKIHSSSENNSLFDSEKTAPNNNTSNNNKISNDDIDFDKLLKYLNEKTGKKMRVVNKSCKQSFKARLKDGYKKEDIMNAISNAVKNSYHKENNFQYLTVEFFTRASTLDKYAFISTKIKSTEAKSSSDKIKIG